MATKQQGGCLSTFFSIFRMGQKKNTQAEYAQLPYKRKEYLLTKAEQSFYHALVKVLNGKFLICPKVRMSDILTVDKKKVTKTYTFFNKITSKHIDFLLCDPRSLTPLLAIELDDKSHQREDRQKRDFFVNKAFADAGMPLVHIKIGYSTEDIITAIKPYLINN